MSNSSDNRPDEGAEKKPSNPSSVVGHLGESAKITAIIAIMAIAFFFVYKKIKSAGVTWDQVSEGFQHLPIMHIIVAVLLTMLNYIVLTGYDWIAVRHLKKELPVTKIMAGAIVGYAFGNVLGWLLGGNAVRYRLYSTWGFSLLEIIAFVSILSITFWLGLFLLAGVAFVALPIHLPPDILEMLVLEPHVWGYVFLSCVAGYLLSCIFIRRPIRFKEYEVALPPFKLSAMQLVVSAGDFLLATTVLYALLPPDVIGPDKINFSTVLIAYLTAQICAVISHVPGGYGILESILVTFLVGHTADVFVAVILFRVIYYFAPFGFASLIVFYNEYRVGKRPAEMLNGK